MPNFGHSLGEWASQTLMPDLALSTTGGLPAGSEGSVRIQCTAPFVPSVIWIEVWIQWSWSGARLAEPITTPAASTFSWMIAREPDRASDVVMIGSVAVPGCFICMMCVKRLVGWSVWGMNIE